MTKSFMKSFLPNFTIMYENYHFVQLKMFSLKYSSYDIRR